MGHAIPGVQTTEVYADADPNDMKAVVDGIEAIMDEIAAHTKVAPVRCDARCWYAAGTDAKFARIYLGQKGRKP